MAYFTKVAYSWGKDDFNLKDDWRGGGGGERL